MIFFLLPFLCLLQFLFVLFYSERDTMNKKENKKEYKLLKEHKRYYEVFKPFKPKTPEL